MRQETVYKLEHYDTYEYGLRLYTLRHEASSISMAADFFSRMSKKAKDNSYVDSQLGLLLTAVERIDKRKNSLFEPNCLRPENYSRALPSKPSYLRRLGIEEEIALRLYCYPAGDRTLILFNGDIKTKNDPRDCPNVDRYFRQALELGEKLEQASDLWKVDSNGIIHWDPPELVY